MSLAFPNAARSFDDIKRRFRFLGHDGMFEVKFFVDVDVVTKELSERSATERDLLAAFDRMRDKIHIAAHRLYKAKPLPSILISSGDL